MKCKIWTVSLNAELLSLWCLRKHNNLRGGGFRSKRGARPGEQRPTSYGWVQLWAFAVFVRKSTWRHRSIRPYPFTPCRPRTERCQPLSTESQTSLALRHRLGWWRREVRWWMSPDNTHTGFSDRQAGLNRVRPKYKSHLFGIITVFTCVLWMWHLIYGCLDTNTCVKR